MTNSTPCGNKWRCSHAISTFQMRISPSIGKFPKSIQSPLNMARLQSLTPHPSRSPPKSSNPSHPPHSTPQWHTPYPQPTIAPPPHPTHCTAPSSLSGLLLHRGILHFPEGDPGGLCHHCGAAAMHEPHHATPQKARCATGRRRGQLANDKTPEVLQAVAIKKHPSRQMFCRNNAYMRFKYGGPYARWLAGGISEPSFGSKSGCL